MWKFGILIASMPLLWLGNTIQEVQIIDRNDMEIARVSHVDYRGFVELSQEVELIRKSKKIDIATFMQFAREPNTMILDTRSQAAFQESHLRGVVNLNFSDFTDEKLAKVIPSKTTRILIYCNNNFEMTKEERLVSMIQKMPPLALNIPTYINLHGYGYTNVYELESLLPIDHEMLVVNKK